MGGSGQQENGPSRLRLAGAYWPLVRDEDLSPRLRRGGYRRPWASRDGRETTRPEEEWLAGFLSSLRRSLRQRSSFQADLELVQRVLRRDPEARARFLDRMRCIPRILHAKNLRLQQRVPQEELRDLAQEVFALVWSKLGEFEGRGCLEAWIYRFCCNVLMNAWQRQDHHPRPLEGSGLHLPETTVESPMTTVDREVVLRAMETLDRGDAEVVELKYVEGLTFQEIGARLGIPPNSAKTRCYRGLDLLRRRLRVPFGESAHG